MRDLYQGLEECLLMRRIATKERKDQWKFIPFFLNLFQSTPDSSFTPFRSTKQGLNREKYVPLHHFEYFSSFLFSFVSLADLASCWYYLCSLLRLFCTHIWFHWSEGYVVFTHIEQKFTLKYWCSLVYFISCSVIAISYILFIKSGPVYSRTILRFFVSWVKQ